MLSIKFIRENKDLMKEVVKNKGIDLDIDHLLDLDKKRREFIQKSEEIKSRQKKLGLKERQKAVKLKEKFKTLNKEVKEINQEYQKLMLLVILTHLKKLLLEFLLFVLNYQSYNRIQKMHH